MRSRLLALPGVVALLATAGCARLIPPRAPAVSPELAIREEAVRQVAALRASALGDSLPLAACSLRRHFPSGSAAAETTGPADAAGPPTALASDASDERAAAAGTPRLLPPAPAPRFDAPPATAAPCADWSDPLYWGGFVGYRLPNAPWETWTVDEIRRRGDEVLVRTTVHRVERWRYEAWWFRVATAPQGGQPPVLEYRGIRILSDYVNRWP